MRFLFLGQGFWLGDSEGLDNRQWDLERSDWGAQYGVQRRGLGLVEIELGIPGKVDPTNSVKVAFAIFFYARTLPCSSRSSHIEDFFLDLPELENVQYCWI